MAYAIPNSQLRLFPVLCSPPSRGACWPRFKRDDCSPKVGFCVERFLRVSVTYFGGLLFTVALRHKEYRFRRIEAPADPQPDVAHSGSEMILA